MRSFGGVLPQARQRSRGRLARAAVVTVILCLGVQFFRVQVLKHTTYALRSDENRIRALPVPAPRGTIYDREGSVVAENVPGYSIAVLPASIDSLRLLLTELSDVLDHSDERAAQLIQQYRRHPNSPVVIEADATFAEISAVEERRAHLPGGIVIETAPKRHYPWGSLMAHVLGYVGEITESELENSRFEDYRPGAVIGRTGIEQVYEDVLAGTPGVRYVEVNALGRIVGEFRGREPVAPTPGRDLRLNLDLELQRQAAELFPDTMRGAVVAMDPRTGGVLAMYSAPSFDPNAFVGGIESAMWRALNTDPARPMFNRAVSATYAPGSTFKLVIAGIAMANGYAGIRTHMPIPCRGALLYFGRVFRDWKPEGHGNLDLHGAIRESCDVYFYQLGLKVSRGQLFSGVEQFGFRQRTGVDLPSETLGIFPTSDEWYDERYGRSGWTNSIVLNLSIGQGENDQTPLKMTQFFAALANGGTLPTPRVADGGPPADPAGRIPLEPGQIEQLKGAVVGVVNEQHGTARGSRLRRWTLAGKTGTSQNPHGEDHASFIGFAPADDPVIVAMAIVEQGGHGSAVAAPIVSRLIDFHLERAGLEPEPDLAAR